MLKLHCQRFHFSLSHLYPGFGCTDWHEDIEIYFCNTAASFKGTIAKVPTFQKGAKMHDFTYIGNYVHDQENGLQQSDWRKTDLMDAWGAIQMFKKV